MSFAVAGDKYDRFMGRYSRELAPRLIEFARVEPGMRALDVGCGPGALTERLAELLGAENVAAADPSEPFVAAVSERAPGVDVRQAAAEELPWEDDSFDAALSQLVVNFMRDADAGLAQMRRVVRPGGIVAACTWSYGEDMEMLRGFWDAARQLDSGAPDEGSTMPYRSAEELADLWSRGGLSEVETDHLRVETSYAGFDDLWEPFTYGVGPAGAYLGAPGARAAGGAPLVAVHEPGRAGRRVHAGRRGVRGARRGLKLSRGAHCPRLRDREGRGRCSESAPRDAPRESQGVLARNTPSTAAERSQPWGQPEGSDSVRHSCSTRSRACWLEALGNAAADEGLGRKTLGAQLARRGHAGLVLRHRRRSGRSAEARRTSFRPGHTTSRVDAPGITSRPSEPVLSTVRPRTSDPDAVPVGSRGRACMRCLDSQVKPAVVGLADAVAHPGSPGPEGIACAPGVGRGFRPAHAARAPAMARPPTKDQRCDRSDPSLTGPRCAPPFLRNSDASSERFGSLEEDHIPVWTSRDACAIPAAAGLPRRADEGTRTPDPLLTMEVLYQLSYVGAEASLRP